MFHSTESSGQGQLEEVSLWGLYIHASAEHTHTHTCIHIYVYINNMCEEKEHFLFSTAARVDLRN